MNLNDLTIPFSKRMEWMEDNGGGITPFYEISDKGDCMCKLCKDPKMYGKSYWRVPALVNSFAAYVCQDCYDLWVESDDEYWLTDNIKGIENPKIDIMESINGIEKLKKINMPKSKRSLKRRKKVKNKPKVKDFNAPYMKTDGQSRVCKYDKNHNFLGYATDEEAENF